MDDVTAYKERIDRVREMALDQLVEEAQREDMGYDLRGDDLYGTALRKRPLSGAGP